MESFIASVAVQIPLVALFIWYNERSQNRAKEERVERDREWREWMERSEAARLRLREELHNRMATEMARLSTAIQRMDDQQRTRPRKRND